MLPLLPAVLVLAATPERELVLVPPGAKRLEATTLSPRRREDEIAPKQTFAKVYKGTRIKDNTESMPLGMSLFVLRLAPRQKMNVKLQADGLGEMFMRFVPQPTQDAMSPQVWIANQPPKTVRSRRIAIRNAFDKPTDVVLGVYGGLQVPFVLTFEYEG